MEDTGQTPEVHFMPWYKRLFGVFYEPSKVFRSLDERPDWVWSLAIPILVTIILSTVAVFLAIRSPEYYKALEKFNDTQKQYASITAYIGVVFAVIFRLGFIFLVGGIIHVIAPFMNGKSSYSRIISVLGYSYLPYFLVGILSIISLVSNPGNYSPLSSSLSVFWTKKEVGIVMLSLLGEFDVIKFWVMGLSTGGLAIIFKFGWKKALTIVLLIWLVTTGIKVGWTAAMKPFIDKSEEVSPDSTDATD